MTDQIFIMIFQWKNKFKPRTHHIVLFPSSFKSVWKCAVSQIYAWSFRFPLLSLLLLKMVSGLLLPRASVERGLQTYMVTSGSLQTSALGRWVWLAAWLKTNQVLTGHLELLAGLLLEVVVLTYLFCSCIPPTHRL